MGIQPLKEGLDYYIENGAWVFTAYFLKNRGYCCKNKCRHCPYTEWEKLKTGNKVLKKDKSGKF